MQTSPVDSLTEDIDLLIASIGLLSSIVDVKEPSIPPPLNDSKQQQQPPYDKEPPCDVPRGIGEESCPPSPTQHHSLRLNLPQQYSDQETTSPSSSGDSARYPSLLTPQQSLALGDELLSSISSPGGGGGEGGGLSEESFPSRLHIERMLTTRSSQMLPPESATPVDSDEVKPLPSIPQEMSKVEESESKQDSTPPPPPPPPPTVSRAYPKRLDSTDSTTAPESPSIRNLRDFHKMYNSKQFLFGTHSRTRSAPSNNILNNLDLSSTSSSSSDTPRPRVRQGRPAPLDADHVRSMFEILPPVPKSPPPVPMTVEGRTLSRQNSTKALPSQLRYQLSRGSLRRPLPPPPHRLPPLSGLDDRPRPQTEFRVGQAPLSFSSIPARVPYTSPPGRSYISRPSYFLGRSKKKFGFSANPILHACGYITLDGTRARRRTLNRIGAYWRATPRPPRTRTKRTRTTTTRINSPSIPPVRPIPPNPSLPVHLLPSLYDAFRPRSRSERHAK